jgi:phosphate transport system protein
MEGHIVRTFDGDIHNLRLQVLRLGGLSIEQVRRAVAALTTGDDDEARAVVGRTPDLSALAKVIEEEIISLIARRQPVASDLRVVLTAGRVAANLERVGFCARRIARLAIELHLLAGDAPLAHFYHDVRKMSRLAGGMLRDALDCFDRTDLAGATAVADRDDDLDAEFQMALRDLLTYVLEDQRFLRNAIKTVFVIKTLERVGDLARDIANETYQLGRREGSTDAPLKVAERTGPMPVSPDSTRSG